MRVRVEQSLLIGGVISSFWMVLETLFHRSMANGVHEFFSGGNVGGLLLGILILAGILGCVFFLVNVLSGIVNLWFARLCVCMLFFCMAGAACSFY